MLVSLWYLPAPNLPHLPPTFLSSFRLTPPPKLAPYALSRSAQSSAQDNNSRNRDDVSDAHGLGKHAEATAAAIRSRTFSAASCATFSPDGSCLAVVHHHGILTFLRLSCRDSQLMLVPRAVGRTAGLTLSSSDEHQWVDQQQEGNATNKGRDKAQASSAQALDVRWAQCLARGTREGVFAVCWASNSIAFVSHLSGRVTAIHWPDLTVLSGPMPILCGPSPLLVSAAACQAVNGLASSSPAYASVLNPQTPAGTRHGGGVTAAASAPPAVLVLEPVVLPVSLSQGAAGGMPAGTSASSLPASTPGAGSVGPSGKQDAVTSFSAPARNALRLSSLVERSPEHMLRSFTARGLIGNALAVAQAAGLSTDRVYKGAWKALTAALALPRDRLIDTWSALGKGEGGAKAGSSNGLALATSYGAGSVSTGGQDSNHGRGLAWSRGEAGSGRAVSEEDGEVEGKGVQQYLALVSDRQWVVRECESVVCGSAQGMSALLNLGLHCTAAMHQAQQQGQAQFDSKAIRESRVLLLFLHDRLQTYLAMNMGR